MDNELYLAIAPLIFIGGNGPLGFGLTEQAITLYPDKKFATKFSKEEVDKYILTFENRANKYLMGGNVTGYKIVPEPTEDGRVIVRVTQHVTD
jgi:hypothetical protein